MIKVDHSQAARPVDGRVTGPWTCDL